MRFSIIIPAYNAQRYLAEALDSVSAQGFGDFETIIVDDGSTDGTPAVADAYAASHEHVYVLHGENKGPLLARRAGILRANGDYLVFLDADDCLRADALEVVSGAIETTGADIVSFGLCRDMGFCCPAGLDDQLKAGFYAGDDYNLVKRHVCYGRFNNLANKAIRRVCVDCTSDWVEYAGLKHGEDLFQLLPIIDSATSLVQIEDILYYYRPSDLSGTACYRPSQLRDIVRVNGRLREYASHWSGECSGLVVRGEINQYMYLVKTSELSEHDKMRRTENFSTIRAAMVYEGVFDRIHGVCLRFDNSLLMHFLKTGNHAMARLVIRGVEWLKTLSCPGLKKGN